MRDYISVPKWQLADILNTLRMVATTYNCKERDSCLKRNVMKSYHDITDIINEKPIDMKNHIDRYMTKGLEPEPMGELEMALDRFKLKCILFPEIENDDWLKKTSFRISKKEYEVIKEQLDKALSSQNTPMQIEYARLGMTVCSITESGKESMHMKIVGMYADGTVYLDFDGNEGDKIEENIKNLRVIPT